jgi:hypothetical protein
MEKCVKAQRPTLGRSHPHTLRSQKANQEWVNVFEDISIIDESLN